MLLRGSPLVPDQFGSKIAEAESRWDELCASRPEYFDGGLLAVGGVLYVVILIGRDAKRRRAGDDDSGSDGEERL